MHKIQSLFTESLKNTDCGERIENLFLYHSSPVLSGAKPAAMFALQKECAGYWGKKRNKLRKATGLPVSEITVRGENILLFIYSEKAITALLDDEQTQIIIRHFGYPSGNNLDAMLKHMKKRFLSTEFPHEIGIFLGYPHEDVQGFIKNGGKNYLCCKYWKVYGDIERSQKIFSRISETQTYAASVLTRSLPVLAVANMLKNYNLQK